MRAIVLSAGFGKRLRPHTETVAKTALPFLNIPMLGYSVYLLECLGVERAAINLHYLSDTVKRAAVRLNSKIQFQYFDEQPEILDSGGGVKNAEIFLADSEDFLIFNGDTISLFDDPKRLQSLIDKHKKTKAIATLLVTDPPSDQGNYGGVCLKPGRSEVDFFSKKASSASERSSGKSSTEQGPAKETRHYVGVCVCSAKIFEHLPAAQPSNLFYDGLSSAMSAGHRVETLYFQNEMHWFETGNEKDYLAATLTCLRILADKNSPYHQHLTRVLDRFLPAWSQHFLPDKQGLLLRSPLAKIDASAKFNDFAVIGDNVEVQPFCNISGSVILADTVLPAKSQIENQIKSPY